MCLGIPGQVIEISGEGLEKKGIVSFGQVTKEVSLACLPDAVCGDYVLVHVGLAISKIDAEEAAKTFAVLEALDEVRH